MAKKRGRKKGKTIGEVDRDPKSLTYVDGKGNVYEKKKGESKKKIGEVDRDPKSIVYVTGKGTVKEMKRKSKSKPKEKPKEETSKTSKPKKRRKTPTRIVKKGNKADIISANPKTETIKVRTEKQTSKGKTYGSRSYVLSTKSGLSPKRTKK